MEHLGIGRAANGIMEMYEKIHPDGSPSAGKAALSLNWSLMASGSSRRPQPTLLLWGKRTASLKPWKYPSFIDSIVELQKTAAAASIARAGRGSVS